MYIQNLSSETLPKIEDWGEKKHVPLNIRETEGTDENGEPKTKYLYDCVEKVDQPINVDNIVKAAVESKFDAKTIEYVTRNFAKKNDSTVEEYKAFVEEITDAAIEAGYE